MRGDAMHELHVHKAPRDATQDWSQFGTPLGLLLKHYLGALAAAPAPVSRAAQGCRYNQGWQVGRWPPAHPSNPELMN
jgi:hypothetical protein